MADTGFVIVGTGANVDRGKTDWTNPGNITAQDDTAATCSVPKDGGQSDWLRATNAALSAVPDGATIDGIEVQYRRKASGTNSISTVYVQLCYNGSTLGDAKLAPDSPWGTSYANTNAGGATDKWGATLTSAIVKHSTFGFQFYVGNDYPTAARTASVDACWIKVYYTPPATTAYKDIPTRFKLWVRSFTDIPTRFKLWARSYADIPTRFKLTIQPYQDIATRFKLWAQNYVDVTTRFNIWVQNYTDIATRFKLWATSYSDIATRFVLNARNYADVATRFILQVRNFNDVATRFRIIVSSFSDIATRFRTIARGYSDIDIRALVWGVTTEPATGVDTTQATVHGIVISPDGADCTIRGFEWGTVNGGPYPYTWTEQGIFAPGPYSHTIIGLTPGQTYYFRAKAAR